ncbi:hemophore-related protein [Nocardia testacea]|uniref:hemophore-related protein n=1 Tax=Nocardia testacea TaxID=248551 RepID=UPI001FE00111|nr:hemophore-related protein [Nocardia testacea]
MIETTCSFAQADAAVHAQFPETAARLDANPERKAELEERHESPEAQRRIQTMRTIAENCHNY